jgi:serine/threonine-protein kinase
VTGTVAGRYEIERELGRGGMATVYLARDLRHDSQVALKVLRSELGTQLGGERFHREIRITAKLQHPNILSVFDSGEHTGQPFYVMPFVEGETLEARLAREGPLPIETALDIAGQIADALDYAHSLGFVHRDVKPSNILLSRGHALLADFGIARPTDTPAAERLTEAGLAVGTVNYMSPEQALGGTIDGRSDTYSLACVLYEMLTGSPPFTGSPQIVLARHSADTVPNMRAARESIPAHVERAILRALSKLPSDRFESAGEFKTAIQTPGATDRYASPAESKRSVRRVAGLAALGVIVIAAIAIAVWQFALPASGRMDMTRVMVFPLRVSDRATALQSVGEDVATLIGNALDGVGDLRWIDGVSLAGAAANEGRTIDEGTLRRLAREQRAGYFVWGNIIPTGDSVEVAIRLYDTATGDRVDTHTQNGPVDDAWRLGLQGVNQVLPTIIPGAGADLVSDWLDRRPAAIARFLIAESAFRRLHLAEALEYYRGAVEADPTFALAAIRGAQAATWNHRPPAEVVSLIETALAQPLAPRYVHFALGYQAYVAGYADSAAVEFRRTIALDPESVPAWVQLGEVYMHLLPLAGNPDSLAEAALQRAYELDPTATYVLYHLLEIRLRQGRPVDNLVAQFTTTVQDSTLVRKIRIMHECVTTGADGIDWTDHARRDPNTLLYAGGTLAGGLAQAACAEQAFTALLRVDTAQEASNRQWTALMGLQALLVARGATAEAMAAIDGVITRYGFGDSLFLLGAPIVESFRARADSMAQIEANEYGEDYSGFGFPTRIWELGLVQATMGRVAVADAVARELERRAVRSGSARDRLMAGSVKARVELERGNDAAAAALLHELVTTPFDSDALKWDEATPMGLERLEYARLLGERGEWRRAIEVANVFDSSWPVVYPLYVPASLELRARAATELGDDGLAAQFERRLADMQDRRPAAGR